MRRAVAGAQPSLRSRVPGTSKSSTVAAEHLADVLTATMPRFALPSCSFLVVIKSLPCTPGRRGQRRPHPHLCRRHPGQAWFRVLCFIGGQHCQ